MLTQPLEVPGSCNGTVTFNQVKSNGTLTSIDNILNLLNM